jgi:hypothetical protein
VGSERNRLIYKRGCQEHFSPTPEARILPLRSIETPVGIRLAGEFLKNLTDALELTGTPRSDLIALC